MKKKLTGILSLLLAFSLVLSACGGEGGGSSNNSAGNASNEGAESSGASSEAEGGEELAEDQTLNVLLGTSVSTLDINAYKTINEHVLIGNVLEGLFRVLQDENGNSIITNAGCESYEVSEDGLTYTFHLRENYWSDGEPVTASQYVDSYVRELTADNGYGNISYYNYVKNGAAFYEGTVDASELGIRAIDDSTLEIVAEQPDLDIINNLTYSGYPIRLDLIDGASLEYGTDVSEMVFNGPFKATAWIPDNSMTLEKNPYFWDADNVHLETINLSYVLETGTQATLFEAGQLDVVEYNEDYGEQWNAQAENGEIQKIVEPRARVTLLRFDCTGGVSGVMSSAKIRLALSLAIDRQELLDTVYDRYYPAYDMVPFFVTLNGETFNVEGEGTIKDLQEQYNTDEALQQLIRDGLDELNYDYNDLSDLTLSYVGSASTTQEQAFVEYLKQVWESRLGINIDLVITTDMGAAYDISSFSNSDYNSPKVFLNIFNQTRQQIALVGNYGNDEVQELLESTTGVTDIPTLYDTLQQVEEIALSEGACGPLYWSDYIVYTQPYVKGLQVATFGQCYDYTYAYVLAH